jgi:hypothetical protein
MGYCKDKLLKIWSIGFAILFLLLIVQTFMGKYGNKYADVVGWLVALTVPTLSLMFGVFIADKQGTSLQEIPADRTLYKIASVSSLIYFLLIYLVFLVEPLVSYSPFQLMDISKPFFGVLNGFITLIIGYFFVKRQT